MDEATRKLILDYQRRNNTLRQQVRNLTQMLSTCRKALERARNTGNTGSTQSAGKRKSRKKKNKKK